MTEPDSMMRPSIDQPSSRRETVRGCRMLLALLICTGTAACQTERTGVYLDPQANLGTPPIQQKAGSPAPSIDAQGQANDEFDTQSWVDRRRPLDDSTAPRARRQTPRASANEDIPLLHPPTVEGPDLTPSMFRRPAQP